MSAAFELIQDAGLFGTAVVLIGLPAAALAFGGLAWALRAPPRARAVTTTLGIVGLALLALTFAGYASGTRTIDEALAFVEPDQHVRLMAFGQSALHGLLGLGFAAAALPLAGAAGAAGRTFAKGAAPVPTVSAGALFVGTALALVGLAAHHLVHRQIQRLGAVSDTPGAMKAALLAGQGELRLALGLGLAGVALAVVGAGLTQIQKPKADRPS